jgi:hypothetical protein
MTGKQHQVANKDELLAVLADPGTRSVIVTADLAEVPGFLLSPGQTLRGNGQGIRFAAGQDGVRLSSDNEIAGLVLMTETTHCALLNDTSVEGLGRMSLRDLSVVGCIRLLARDNVRGGHVEVHKVDVIAADARAYGKRPKGYGVEVVAGAFTLWNQQTDPAVTITADLTGLSAGRAGAPVRGSGIFVGGAGDIGGGLIARRLETGAVFSDGGIDPGTPDRIAGGVFTIHGAFVDRVCNHGPVTTFGANDMALDNWGTVDAWIAEDKVTSHGPSGIGFVNFGAINRLELQSVVETFGQGARGFNVYTGTVRDCVFDRIVTHGDGAVGIQISQPVGEIIVRRGIETYGGVGDSLVKGVVTQLSAIALSVKPGGSARRIEIAGGLITHGEGVNPLELHGAVDAVQITGGITAVCDGFGTI